MNDLDNGVREWEAANRAVTLKVAVWTGAWVGTLALATFGPEFLWQPTSPLTLVGILVNVGAGIGMIAATIGHLKSLDELQQKIQLEALGLALGAALIGGMAWSTLDVTNLMPFDAEVSHVVFFTVAVYALGLFAGHRRYR